MIFDVVIVGGGPAGTVSALVCEKSGLDILLLDKEVFPREKPCGGALSFRAKKLLSTVGVGLPDHIIEKRAYGIRVHKPDDSVFLIGSEDPVAFFVKRKNLDSHLFNRVKDSNVTVFEGKRVKKVIRKNGGFEIITGDGDSYRSKVVVGADGSASVVARTVGFRKRWRPERSGLCLQSEPAVPETVLEKEFGEKRMLEVFFGRIYGGYAWLFPKRDCVNVGIGGFRHKIQDIGKDFRRFCDKISFIDYEELDINGYVIPAGGFNRRVVSDNVLLVGDAAGFVDSVGGEGIYYSVKSGILAGESLLRAKRKNGFDNARLMEYQERCWKSFGGDLRSSYLLSLLFNVRPNLFLPLLQKDQKSRNLFIEILREDKTYSDLLKKFLTRLPLSIFKKFLTP